MEIDDNIFQAIQACWTGKASPEQIELIQDWLDTSQENRDLFERLSMETYRFPARKRKIEFPSKKTKEILPLEIPCIRCSSRLLNSFCGNEIHSSRTLPGKNDPRLGSSEKR